MRNSKDAYQKKLQAKLDGWNAEIEQLKAKADESSADARIQTIQKLGEVRKKRKRAELKLKELKADSGDAWRYLKQGVDRAFSSLGHAVQSVRSSIQ